MAPTALSLHRGETYEEEVLGGSETKYIPLGMEGGSVIQVCE